MERKLKADRSIAVGEGAWTFDGIEDDFGDLMCTQKMDSCVSV